MAEWPLSPVRNSMGLGPKLCAASQPARVAWILSQAAHPKSHSALNISGTNGQKGGTDALSPF